MSREENPITNFLACWNSSRTGWAEVPFHMHTMKILYSNVDENESSLRDCRSTNKSDFQLIFKRCLEKMYNLLVLKTQEVDLNWILKRSFLSFGGWKIIYNRYILTNL